jgi:hypothetical protein
MIDAKAAVMIGTSFAGAIAFCAAVYGWTRWIARPQASVDNPRGRDALLQDERLQRIEHAVEAIAIEVERLGEGQRYTTKVLAEGSAAERAVLRPIAPRTSITPH